MTALLPSWRRSLAARRISPRAIATYTISAAQLADYLAAHGTSTTVAGIRREHVEAILEDLLTRKATATAHNGFRGCQALLRWCVEEGEVRESPICPPITSARSGPRTADRPP